MARPLRLEFDGALYHLTARGDRGEQIYVDDNDRQEFLRLLGKVCLRFDWAVYAYCLMSNHYHIVAETRTGNLAKGMRQLNGVYTQYHNRRHGRVGHVFQGRYKAMLVQKETYLLEVCRYVVLNPVRAGMVADPADWLWSSYRAMVGRERSPAWLDVDWVLGQFGRRPTQAVERYTQFVRTTSKIGKPWEHVRHQVLLGDEEFISRFKKGAKTGSPQEVPRSQRRALAQTLEDFRKSADQRDEAMAQAYFSGAYTMKEIGEFFGVHYMTVSRAVRKFENAG